MVKLKYTGTYEGVMKIGQSDDGETEYMLDTSAEFTAVPKALAERLLETMPKSWKLVEEPKEVVVEAAPRRAPAEVDDLADEHPARRTRKND